MCENIAHFGKRKLKCICTEKKKKYYIILP
jgi:hypothetical protein